MIIRFTRTITLPSGNEARNFRFNDRGYGRVQVTYEYADRRRNHQTARRFKVEFLNGKIDSIQARSINGGRVEYFKTSTILAELLEMLAGSTRLCMVLRSPTDPNPLRSRRLKPNRTAPLSTTPLVTLAPSDSLGLVL